MNTARIFLSSPGDVGPEREMAAEVFRRLQAEFSGLVKIDAYFWENEPMRAHTDYQGQIEPPSHFDLFVCILWARLGTRLHPSLHRKSGGGEYASGTEYELEDAIEGYKRSHAPEILIYKRTAQPDIKPEPKEERERAFAQYDSLNEFFTQFTQKDGRFVVAINNYTGLEQFERKFESDMRKLLERFVPKGVAASRTIPKSWTQGSPFRGLRHFDFEHAPIFFGRTRNIDEVLTALKKQAANDVAFVVVFGGSGVGKSSLVRAGVLPWLIKPGVIDGVGLWRRCIIRPGEITQGDLFDALATLLLHPEALPEIGSDGTDANQLAALLREKPDGVGMLIKGALSQAARDVQLKEDLEKQPRALFALVIDQLEELFTVERIAAQREAFLRALDALARSGYVWVVATLRSDFYSRCEESSLLMKLKQDSGQYHLQPPDETQLGQMIRLPVAAAGLLFEEDFKTGERLDDLLLFAAVKSPGALPLLEFALEELYQQRDKETGLLRLQTYRDLEGVEGALAKKAEESFLSTSEEAQKSFDTVFRRLVTIGQGREPTVRRRATKGEVETSPVSRELVTRLISDRLLVADRTQTGSEVISIAHEAMLDRWSRLKQWVTEHRESLKIRAQVAEDAARWIENNRSPDYLYAGGAPLEKANSVMESNFLNTEESDFVRASLSKVEKQLFYTSLLSGEQMLESSRRIRAGFPDVHLEVLRQVLRETRPSARCNAAWLISEETDTEVFDELIRLVTNDSDAEVRRAAASSLVKLNRRDLFAELTERADTASSDVIAALSEIRIAADASEKRSLFDDLFGELKPSLQWQVRLKAWVLRFKRGVPILLFVCIPAVLFSTLSAAGFKWMPGILNYALCQANPSAAMGVFHGVTAAVVWGGGITLGLVTYRVVFGRQHGIRSFLRPFPAIVTGAMVGCIGSMVVLLIIATVYDSRALETMGWLMPTNEGTKTGLWHVLFWETRFAWPYLIMGTFLGIGMALMVNGLRASVRWPQFLSQQTSLTSVRETWRLIRALAKMAMRFVWPIPIALLIAGAIAFFVLRSAPASGEWRHSRAENLTAGLSHEPETLREWKISPWGEALGIIGDGATQAIGGFFAIVGMGLGLVIVRYGLKVEPQSS